MKQTVIGITLVAVVIHLVGGCCWHHAHSAAGDIHLTHAVPHSHHDDPAGGDSHHNECSVCNADCDHEHAGCDYGPCILVFTGRKQITERVTTGYWIAETHPVPAVVSPQGHHTFRPCDAAQSLTEGKVRLHLSIRVMIS